LIYEEFEKPRQRYIIDRKMQRLSFTIFICLAVLMHVFFVVAAGYKQSKGVWGGHLLFQKGNVQANCSGRNVQASYFKRKDLPKAGLWIYATYVFGKSSKSVRGTATFFIF